MAKHGKIGWKWLETEENNFADVGEPNGMALSQF